MSLSDSVSPLRRFDRVAFGLLAGVMALILCYLTGACMLITHVVDIHEVVTQISDSLWLSLLLPAIGILLCRAVLLWERRAPLRLLTGLTLGLVFAMGCAWVLIARVEPAWDADTLHRFAGRLIQGDSSVLEEDYYLPIFTHQIGFLQFSELLQRIFGVGSYLPQGILNAAFLTAGYAALLDVLWQSLHSRRVQLVALALMVTCLPPVFFCTFLYGTLPGLCLSLWALALTVRWIRGARWPWLILACVLMAIAVALKPNYLIFALALALVLTFCAISARRFGALALAVCLLLGAVGIPKAAQRLLEYRTETELGSGSPKLTWLAMGLQDGPESAGWFNGYTYSIPLMYMLDFEMVEEQALSDIEERLTYFASHPEEARIFFRTKLLSQWTETTYESLFINRVMHNKRTPPHTNSVRGAPQWQNFRGAVGVDGGLCHHAVRGGRIGLGARSPRAPSRRRDLASRAGIGGVIGCCFWRRIIPHAV